MSRTDRRDIVRGLGALGLFGAVAMPGAAWAQNDLTPPLPNVLLLVDSSGSMERMIDGTMPENVGAACTPGTPMSKDQWNRWATLVQVLTGDIENFSCQAIDRKSQAFVSEYSWNGVKPYDFQYHLPFHRLVSNDCVAGPGAMDPTNWFDWPAPAPGNPFLAQGALKYHSYTDPNAPCATPFKATSPGLLDTFINQIRFGLMTIDSLPDKGTGASGTSHNAATGMAGQWSYYQDWDNGGTSATGQLPGCQFGVDYEVGTRNPAAPAWEGRLISFGHYDAGVAELTATNNQIQEALLSMRPHGRTSLGGAFQDTEDFFVHDDFPDPKNPGQFLGPAGDPFFTAGCRPSYVILLSDGESEAELRPDCTAVNGCPFSTADTIAGELATLSPMPVQTYVVGFGVQQQGNVDCATLDATAFGPGGACASPASNMKACCTLAQIAVSGGTGHAFFASDVSGLAQSLSQILSQISASSSTSRTLPVVGASANQASADRGFQLLSSFGTPISGDLWYGVLERKRYQCPSNGGAASQIDYDPLKGDAFQDNVNSNDPANPRQFFTAVRNGNGFSISSDRSVRPYLPADDGLGTGTSTPAQDDQLRDGPSFAQYVPPAALGINLLSALAACPTPFKTSLQGECSERLLRWNVGEVNTSLDPALTETRDVAACPTGRTCSELGAIYHSTPSFVGPPREFLRDASYAEFASPTTGQGLRPTMLYAATTDGQLHAFKVAATDPADPFQVDQKANNELWSFMPPAVLPRLLSSYNQRANLLDGKTVVRDVIFARSSTQAEAGATSNGGAAWHTVLLAGGGQAGGFYYALDVTDPTAPKFLWQLSTDDLGSPLFGSTSATPLITSVAVNVGGGIQEVAVAVLPGGSTVTKGGVCPRQTTDFSKVDVDSSDGLDTPRANVRCWGNGLTPGPARSVTIARLDTGEVLMNFRGALTDGPMGLAATRRQIVPFDSPMTGVPVASPGETGKVASRVYVGDADGTLWRLTLTDPNPTNWTAELAWDAYPAPLGADQGQPIDTPPVVSIDDQGNTIVLFSTGDQELFTSSGAIDTRVWSLREVPIAGGFGATGNWMIPFSNGKRVTGPITLFDQVAYFTTFTPQPLQPGSSQCGDGYTHIWGVHFAAAATSLPPSNDPCEHDANAALPYPRPAYPVPNPAAPGYCSDKLDSSVAFGAAIAQTPSCATTQTFTDAFGASYQGIGAVTGGTFELVLQTGAGGQPQDGASTKTLTIPLPSPARITKIDSWACILE
jgi:type IV pilus assembly protein PilY1